MYRAPNPGQAAISAAPLLTFAGVTAFSLSSLPSSASSSLLWPLLESLSAGTIAGVAMAVLLESRLGNLLGDFCEVPDVVKVQRINPKGPAGTQLNVVYSVFGYLQVRFVGVELKESISLTVRI